MAAHRYWRLDNFAVIPTAYGFVTASEVYLRQTAGGSNVVPVASAGSAPATSTTPAILYDGDTTNWWGTNAGGWYVAFDYGTNIDPVELMWQSRPDYAYQSPSSGSIWWSDTGLSGPWTFKSDFSFPAWSTNGQIQTTSVVAPPELRVTTQHGYAVMNSTGLVLTTQHGYAVMNSTGLVLTTQHGYAVLTNSGNFITEQHAYAVLVKSTNTRRRQLMLGSF